MSDYLEIARQVMREQQSHADEPMEAVLKGKAIELWSDALGERFWLVADEADAAKLGQPRGTVYTTAEARRVVQIGDPATVAEIHRWKRQFDGVIREARSGGGNSNETKRKELDEQVRGLQKSVQRASVSRGVARAKTRNQENEQLANAIAAIPKVTGTRSNGAGHRLLDQAMNALIWPKLKEGATEDAIIKAAAFMAEMAPQNVTEGMLSIQMIATNEAALLFLKRATAEGQTFEGSDANVLRATRLMRLHLDQIEAMQKLKGKAGQQKVTVEHVHVHKGGQGIVGAVTAKRAGPGGGG